MSTNERVFRNTRIDEESGELVGEDHEGLETRVSRTDWSETNKESGNWEQIIEELTTDLNFEDIEDADGVRMAIDIDTASELLSARLAAFPGGESGELQARLVLEHLADENRVKVNDSNVVFVEETEEFPTGLINYATYLEVLADQLEETKEMAESRLKDLQERREKLDDEIDDSTDIEQGELADKIREICGEFLYPKEFERSGEGKYLYDVTAPDDIEEDGAREAFEELWAQLLEKEYNSEGAFEIYIVDEYYNKLETDINLLEGRINELRQDAHKTRRTYLRTKEEKEPEVGDRMNVTEGLEHTTRVKNITEQKQDALERDDLKESFSQYEQTASLEREESMDETETDEEVPSEGLSLSSDPDTESL